MWNFMKQVILIGILAVFVFTNTWACINDFQCGFGNICVKSKDSASMNGICVTPTDKFGNKQYGVTPSSEPRKVTGCNFNTDCDVGFSCMKRVGELSGICMK